MGKNDFLSPKAIGNRIKVSRAIRRLQSCAQAMLAREEDKLEVSAPSLLPPHFSHHRHLRSRKVCRSSDGTVRCAVHPLKFAQSASRAHVRELCLSATSRSEQTALQTSCRFSVRALVLAASTTCNQ